MKRTLLAFIFTLLIGGITTGSIDAKTENNRIYMIPVDRFLNNDKSNDVGVPSEENPYLSYGGDFKGIESQLDYIKEMGFDTLQLSPVFEMEESDYLGYAVNNYDEIATRYGGSDEFKQLIETIHENDMKVIVDFPTTATKDFKSLKSPEMTKPMESYYAHIERDFIDLTHSKNQKKYFEIVTEFLKHYDVDGISMYVVQSGLNREKFLPKDVTAYAINLSGGEISGFDYVTDENVRKAVTNGFSSVDKDILEYPTDNTILLADHWFSERFTSESTQHNMFPGTRIKQLFAYLNGYPGPIMFNYGTEVAQNGDEFPKIHPQMDFWTDKEVVDYIKEIVGVMDRHESMFISDIETIKNESGQYVLKYSTNDVDYIYNINNTSKTQKVYMGTDIVPENKELSGLLIGDVVRPHGDEYIAVTDREETELYAIIEPAGFNHWYLISSFIVFGGFAVFILLVARRSKRKQTS
ncbi:alpha-amylase family protein [Phocicoccus pinnipedialis]|uniref:Beta/alpha-amylase n=1 Tax=Phocicoccus pinnipedialis TaxID=110845 RepID=A0A6V7R722_9BACL|nr:alpha-amylase family protein [Jeotgalicoccus pinnipedialis]MBP1938903.1 hypothetical protein [Jeotgalicoccus pinnipedialis]CAD2073257.1 Beta/alpha-amylase precursor [Jeotgalicoccus pinnipedialis]